jgi:hypothetical protein
MAASSSSGGAVTADAAELIMKRIRASFRESATLLLAIAKGEDMIETDDYVGEDLPTIVKKYEAAEKLTNLKMLRRPADLLARIVDPALPSRLGGVVTANIGRSRLSRESLSETRLTVLHDSTVIWHQGLSRSNIGRIDSLELVAKLAAQGKSSINMDWDMTRDLYELGGDVGFWTKALEKFKSKLQARSPVGQTLLWLDLGNTWANSNLVQHKTMNAQAAAYRKLAYGLSLFSTELFTLRSVKAFRWTCGGRTTTRRSECTTRIFSTRSGTLSPTRFSWTSIGGT